MGLVDIKRLHVNLDARGKLAEILRSDSAEGELLGPIAQVYFTTVFPGVVKAWHQHLKQTDRMVCVKGLVRFGFVNDDDRNNIISQEIIMEGSHPSLVIIPPGIWHGFQNLGQEEAVIINCPNLLYNRSTPDEYRSDPDKFSRNFDWYARVDG